jgi:hypothetical protein
MECQALSAFRTLLMALIKSLLAPIRRLAHFPLFQFVVILIIIFWLQAAESNSVLGELFSALDWLVEFSVNQFTALFEVKSFTRSWLTVGFMMGYVYLAGLVVFFLAKVVIRATVELAARTNAFGLRNAIASAESLRIVPGCRWKESGPSILRRTNGKKGLRGPQTIGHLTLRLLIESCGE